MSTETPRGENDDRRRQKAPAPVTIHDVAVQAGVSAATVSRALALPDMVRAETRARVLSAVDALGYTPNAAARHLRGGATMMALVVIPRLTNPFFAEIARGIDQELSAAGYGIIIGDLDDDQTGDAAPRQRERHMADMVFAGHLDGALIMSGSIPKSGTRSIKEAGIPIVALSNLIDDPEVPNILVNDRGATEEATAYMIACGHRRLLFIDGPPGNYGSCERYEGFKDAIGKAGLPADAGQLLPGGYSVHAGAAAAAQFVEMHPRPTAVMASCDATAIGFLRAVRDAGLKPPADVSVIGFDGLEFTAYNEPPLTTMSQPRVEMGQAGARALLRMLREPGVAADSLSATLPAALIKRGSVAGPAT